MSVHVLRPITPTEATDAFLSYLRRRGRADGTINAYRPILDAFAQWAGERRLSELSAADIDFGFFSHWTAAYRDRHNGAEPSPRTLRNVHTTLSSFYRFLTNYGFLTDEGGRAVPNPMLAVEAPTVTSKPNDWLRRPEDEALLSTPMDYHEEILVWFLRCTGLRIGEALALRISDVDIVERTVRVTESKSESGLRDVPITDELLPRVKTWLAHLERGGLNQPRGYFLCTTHRRSWRNPQTGVYGTSEPGSQMSPQTAQQTIRRVGDRAGIERLTPHRLRRTFGSCLLNEGTRLEVVSKLLGHATTSITEQAYAQLTPDTIRREMLEAVRGRRTRI